MTRRISIAVEFSSQTDTFSLPPTALTSTVTFSPFHLSNRRFIFFLFFHISFKPEDVTVRLGEYDFSQVSEARRDFAVDAIYMHESYDRRTYANDIALIKLKTKATFNSDIWPICLPPSNVVLEGQSAFVTGQLESVVLNCYMMTRILSFL